MDGLGEVQGSDQGGEVVGVRIHIIAPPGLAGAAMAAAVMGDAAVAMGGEEEHLVFPSIGAEGPAVAEDDGLSVAPVFVIDGGSVFGGDGVHRIFKRLGRGYKFSDLNDEIERRGFEVNSF